MQRVRESVIEKYLNIETHRRGGRAMKFVSPNRKNVPDRLILWKGGRMDFVECKAEGQAPTEAQVREHKRLRDFGVEVFVISSKAEVDAYVDMRSQNAD